MDEDITNFGNSIELVGFSKMDQGSMSVLRKMVGNHTRIFSEKLKNFTRITITMKPVHERETSEIYELHARIHYDGKLMSAEMTDRNLFYAIDRLMKKLEKESDHP